MLSKFNLARENLKAAIERKVPDRSHSNERVKRYG
jgi:hypothetical protein